MIATQKLKRSSAVSSIQDSKCKEMREWIFLANSSVYNMENTVVSKSHALAARMCRPNLIIQTLKNIKN